MRKTTLRGLLCVAVVFAGCDGAETTADGGPDPTDGGDMGGLPTTPPTSVSMVSNTGFTAPTDAVASPDGSTFYFAAYTDVDEPEPAIFSVPAAGGAVSVIVSGEPLEYPSGLVLSCDGSTLYIADSGGDGADDGDGGTVFSMSVSDGMLTVIDTGIDTPNALAFDADCSMLYVSGVDDGEGAVYRVAPIGGTAETLHLGAPLVDPSGLNIDVDGVAWVMDHLAEGADGPGLLFRIAPGGAPTVVVSGLDTGTPAGVSLVAGGVTAVMPTLDANGEGQLLSVSTLTMEMTTLPAPEILDPAGIRTARSAGVMVVVDSEGGAIFRAE